MKAELLLTNKASGITWDCASCTISATWETNRTGSPGKFSFSLVQSGGIAVDEGDAVRFSVDGQLQFFGWVFSQTRDRWDRVDIVCYDRLRYLKANASYAFYGQTAAGIITQIAEDLQVETGSLAAPPYAIPSLIEEDQSCLDIIEEAVQQTLLNTGDVYVFFDNGAGLSLQRPQDMISPVVIGDRSLLTEYSAQSSIDTQTYNSVKLARPNEATGRADVFVAQDSDTIAQWGLLQLYQTVDGALNDAQAAAQAEATLGYYNRVTRTLQVDALGVPGLRAGQMAYFSIESLGLHQLLLLEKVSHSFEQNVHTMSLETLAL